MRLRACEPALRAPRAAFDPRRAESRRYRGGALIRNDGSGLAPACGCRGPQPPASACVRRAATRSSPSGLLCHFLLGAPALLCAVVLPLRATWGRILSSIASPMPFTRVSWSTDSKRPCSLRSATMASARTFPTPGRSCSWDPQAEAEKQQCQQRRSPRKRVARSIQTRGTFHFLNSAGPRGGVERG